jgi:hypothetical protein
MALRAAALVFPATLSVETGNLLASADADEFVARAVSLGHFPGGTGD